MQEQQQARVALTQQIPSPVLEEEEGESSAALMSPPSTTTSSLPKEQQQQHQQVRFATDVEAGGDDDDAGEEEEEEMDKDERDQMILDAAEGLLEMEPSAFFSPAARYLSALLPTYVYAGMPRRFWVDFGVRFKLLADADMVEEYYATGVWRKDGKLVVRSSGSVPSGLNSVVTGATVESASRGTARPVLSSANVDANDEDNVDEVDALERLNRAASLRVTRRMQRKRQDKTGKSRAGAEAVDDDDEEEEEVVDDEAGGLEHQLSF
jgi:hypothetical protein